MIQAALGKILPTTSSLQLHCCVTESPKKKASVLYASAQWKSIASKVCIVAFIAIVALALSVSLGLMMPIPPSILVALVFGTVPLQLGSSYFLKRATECRSLADIEQRKANELEKIKNWSTQDIEDFFSQHKLSLTSLPLNALKTIEPQEPLRALLPAIAGYRYWRYEADRFFQKFKGNLENRALDPLFRLNGRRHAWHILEREALPALLHAAFLLQIIAQPTLQIQWENFGSLYAKDFDQRTWDKSIDNTDDYFLFNEPNRPPLAFSDLYDLLSSLNIDALRKKLFITQVKSS